MKKISEYLKEDLRAGEFLSENRDMLIKVGVVIVVIAAAFLLFSVKEGREEETAAAEEIEESHKVAAEIYVDIGGQVKNPMVVHLEDGSRIEDAIEAAGGLTAEADMTDINRAAFVEDGEKIYIPSSQQMQGDVGAETGGAAGVAGADTDVNNDGKVNINTADSEALQTLTGVGPATAQKIIDYRNENGRFTAPEDIKNVSGIGDKTYEKMKDNIKVW